MTEKTMRAVVIKYLRELDGVSIECPIQPGVPDVNYTLGWLELKWLKEFPKRETTAVKIPHWSPSQKAWISKRLKAGGRVHVLIQCKREWVLLGGEKAIKHLNQATRLQLIEFCDWYSNNGLNGGLINALQ